MFIFLKHEILFLIKMKKKWTIHRILTGKALHEKASFVYSLKLVSMNPYSRTSLLRGCLSYILFRFTRKAAFVEPWSSKQNCFSSIILTLLAVLDSRGSYCWIVLKRISCEESRWSVSFRVKLEIIWRSPYLEMKEGSLLNELESISRKWNEIEARITS
jgi:hypothetical protein